MEKQLIEIGVIGLIWVQILFDGLFDELFDQYLTAFYNYFDDYLTDIFAQITMALPETVKYKMFALLHNEIQLCQPLFQR